MKFCLAYSGGYAYLLDAETLEETENAQFAVFANGELVQISIVNMGD